MARQENCSEGHRFLGPGPCGLCVWLTLSAPASLAQASLNNRFELPDSRLHLEVVVNGLSTGEVLPVDYRGGRYYLPDSVLRRLGLRLPEQAPSLVDPSRIEGVRVVHDNHTQQLFMTLPVDWLAPQHFTDDRPVTDAQAAFSSTGVLFNYDLYGLNSHGRHPARTLSAWTEQRLFSGVGSLSNSGALRVGLDGRGEGHQQRGYTRHDTQWRYSDEHSLRQVVVGDLISDALAGAGSVRMGGIQVARNFSLRPGLSTYPLPEFSGQATVPSSLELFVNSYRLASHALNPGPFTLQTQPYLNGAGKATIVMRDVLGREVSEEVDFYLTDQLLRPGLLDYSLSSGVLRRQYGSASFDYADVATSGVARYGVTRTWTASGWSEAADGLLVAGAGSSMLLGRLGVLSLHWGASTARQDASAGASRASASHPWSLSAWDESPPDVGAGEQFRGQEWSLSHSYSHQQFGLNLGRVQRTEGYINLAGYKHPGRLSRREDRAIVSLSLGRYGTLGAGWFDVSYRNQHRTRLLNLSHAIGLGQGLHLYTGISKELGNGGYSAQLSVSIPLGTSATASLRLSRDAEGRPSTQVNYGQGVPFSEGVGWNLGLNDAPGTEQYRQADGTWRTPWFEARGGAYGTQAAHSQWGQLRGSVVAMDGQFQVANRLGEAFALVSTGGYPGIPVHYENQLVGKTDAKGYLLIPNVTPWYSATLEIDPSHLPVDLSVARPRMSAAVRQGGGSLLEFPISRVNAVVLILLDRQRRPIAAGSEVRVKGARQVAWVGWEGEVYLESVQRELQMSVTPLGSSTVCEASASLAEEPGVARIGPLICE